MTDSDALSSVDVILRTGSTIRLRLAEPRDDAALRSFFHGLSPAGRAERASGSGGDGARWATEAVEAAAGSATLVAEAAPGIVGVASFFRRSDRPERAEVAFTVDDGLQGQGVGTRLLERLAEVARAQGVAFFEADVLEGNSRMISVFDASGFDVTHRRDGDTARFVVSLAPTPAYEERSARRSEEAAAASIRRLFEPMSVAVVGASREPGKIGAEVFRLLIETGFRGEVIPINPSAPEVRGRRAYPRVTDVPGPVDLAVIVVPAPAVPAAVDDCIAKGVAGLVVISAGFAETGEEGRARELALVEKVRRAGIRMVGPNCMGLLNTDPNVRLNATFSSVFPPEGRVALSSQSGALGLALLDHASQLNLGISTFVSVGNKADVSGNDLLQYWAEDPRTDVILLYLESFGNPRRFSRIARRVARRKPIAAVKSGRTRSGARAATSHTAALAESDAVVDALFRQAGVIRTDTLEELFDVAALLAHQPVPKGRRVAILTNAGGPGILAADTCEAFGLALPALAPETVHALREFLPASASVGNPVDMIASATPENYRRSLELILADPNVDGVIVIFIPPVATDPDAVAAAVVAGASAARGKTVLATFMSARGAPAALRPIPCFPFPESAARALARAAAYGEWRSRPAGQAVEPPGIRAGDARRLINAVLARGGGWLSPQETGDLLAAYGIASAGVAEVPDSRAASAAARRLGFPVALKAVGPRIVHKTEVGGVVLGLATEAEVEEAYGRMAGRLGAEMSGALVQRMVAGGVEVLAGVTQDRTFGPLLAYGGGGTLVELTRDVAMRMLPITDLDAAEMLEEVKATALLRGYRGAPKADEEALREILLRLSRLADDLPEILEMDLNPIKVLERGALVVDARVRAGTPRESAPSRRIHA